MLFAPLYSEFIELILFFLLVDLQFNVSDLHIGILDSLLSLSNDLLKVWNFVFLPSFFSLYIVIHPLRRKFGSYDALHERNHYDSIRSFLPLISKLHKIMELPCIGIKSNCILIGFCPLLWIDHLKKEVIYVWFTELSCILKVGCNWSGTWPDANTQRVLI